MVQFSSNLVCYNQRTRQRRMARKFRWFGGFFELLIAPAFNQSNVVFSIKLSESWQ